MIFFISLALFLIQSSSAETLAIKYHFTERHLTVDSTGKVIAEVIVDFDCSRRQDGATSCLTKEINKLNRKIREFRRVFLPGATFDALVHQSSRQIYEVPP